MDLGQNNKENGQILLNLIPNHYVGILREALVVY